MSWIKVRHLAEYTAFRTAVCVVQCLSYRHSVRLARCLAFIIHHLLPARMNRRTVARENLRRALGDAYGQRRIDEIIHQMWIHLFRMVAEVVQMPRKLRRDNAIDVLEFRHREAVVQALCTGRPVILLSGHFGNWEMATSVFGHFGFPMGVVARELDNPRIHKWMERFRRHTGHVLISKKGGADRMVQFLEHRGHLALLGDQDAGQKGLFVDFFGHPASTFKSIALLSMQYRALICVGYARRLPDRFHGQDWVRYELGCEQIVDPDHYDGPQQIRSITQAYTAALERAVLRAPEQYFWVHRRWKSVPRQRRQYQRAA
ncbi:MAG: lysophospholipid acyltransferase family protein [Planctomycetaceae bacterium]